MDWKMSIKVGALIALGYWLRSLWFPTPQYLLFSAMMAFFGTVLLAPGLMRRIGVLLLLVAGIAGIVSWVIDRRAQRIEADVLRVIARNDECSPTGSRGFYPCTLFAAEVRYRLAARAYGGSVFAGSARGHDQALDQADYRPGDKVPLIYDPVNPEVYFRDGAEEIYEQPIMVAVFGLGMCLAHGRFNRLLSPSTKATP